MSALLVLSAALLLLAWERARPGGAARRRHWAALTAVAAALAIAVLVPPRDVSGGPLVFDAYGAFFNVVLLIVVGLTLVTARETYERLRRPLAGVFPLILLVLFGAMVAGMSREMLLTAVALEGAAACSRRLMGRAWFRHLDVLPGALMIAGGLVSAAAGEAASGGAGAAGVWLMVVGLAARAGAAPFHLTGVQMIADAPAPIGGLVNAGVRAAALAALGRLLLGLPLSGPWDQALWALAALTMVAGSVAAVAQTDLRRLMAYATGANAGFVLMALAAEGGRGAAANPHLSGVLFYLLAHAFMVMGVSALLSAMARNGEHRTALSELAGLGRERPLLAATLSICLLALAGAPLTMGFVGRLYLFAAATAGGLYGLAAIGALASVVLGWAYLRPITWLYMRDGGGGTLPVTSPAYSALGAACLFLLLFGLMPGELIRRCLSGLLSLGL